MFQRLLSVVLAASTAVLLGIAITSARPQLGAQGEIGEAPRHCWSSWVEATPTTAAQSGGITATKEPDGAGGTAGTVRVRTCSGCGDQHASHSEVEVTGGAKSTVSGLNQGDTVEIVNSGATLNGNDTQVDIKGQGTTINVVGNGNQIDVNQNSTVTVNVTGNDNDVDLNGSTSQATTTGTNNHVHN